MHVEEDTGKTHGYCFIEYNNKYREVELAKEKTNGYKLDISHIFVVDMFDEVDRFMRVPDEWAPSEIRPYTPGLEVMGFGCVFVTWAKLDFLLTALFGDLKMLIRIRILGALRSLKTGGAIIGLMIIVSHNKVSDYGVKVADPGGKMLIQCSLQILRISSS